MPINVEDAGNKDKSFTGPKRLAQAFRDYIGQARYQDPNRNGDESNIYTTLKAEYDENGKVEGFNEDESATIPHDDIKIHDKSVNNLNADKVAIANGNVNAAYDGLKPSLNSFKMYP